MLVALAGSVAAEAVVEAGLRVAHEAFADRGYESDGSLRSRRLPGAVLSAAEAVAQAVSIATSSRVTAHDGTVLPVAADTICLHGDTPGAAEYAAEIRRALEAAGVSVAPMLLP